MTITDQGQAKQHLTAPQSTRVTETTRPHTVTWSRKQQLLTDVQRRNLASGILNSFSYLSFIQNIPRDLTCELYRHRDRKAT